MLGLKSAVYWQCVSTHALDYSNDGGWSWRKLPWRRIILAIIVLYFVVYGVLRFTGQITHRWGVLRGKGNDKVLIGHDWDVKFDRGQSIFIPAAALEMAIRDLGPTE